MRVLLVAMPDTVAFLDAAIRLPSLGLASLAGNLPGHEVRTLDLSCAPWRPRRALEAALDGFEPDVVGLTAMTFRVPSMLRAAEVVRRRRPTARIVVGGPHASCAGESLETDLRGSPVELVVRGEGEATFAELIAQLGRRDPDLDGVRGLRYRDGVRWRATPDRPPADLATIALPDRTGRLLERFSYLGRPADIVEASRGCPFDCSFCSIQSIYHRTFRRFEIPRVIADLERIRARGTRHVFFADDNLTSDPEHLREVCDAIVAAGLDDLGYSVQAGAAGLAGRPELVASMARAGFEFCFVGFESMRPDDLRRVSKPATPAVNREAARLLRAHGIAIIAGAIVGMPDDDARSIREAYRLLRELRPDAIYAQFPTPYPGTRLRDELLAGDLVDEVDGWGGYDGFTCNVRTRRLSRDALSAAVARENLRAATDPRLVAGSRFLRRWPVPFALAHLRAVRADLAERLGRGLSRRTGWDR